MTPERTKEAWTALQIAVYAVNCSNTDEYIDEVARLIEEYRQSSPVESKWVSVKERLPERGGEFLALVDGQVKQCFWFDGWFYKAVDQRLNPTHWHRLPELPIEETKEK